MCEQILTEVPRSAVVGKTEKSNMAAIASARSGIINLVSGVVKQTIYCGIKHILNDQK